MQPYGTVHDTVPFDKITLADYEEAMIEGMRREKEEIDLIINDPSEPTFDNTIIKDDPVKGRKHYYDLLDRVDSVFFNILSAETNDEFNYICLNSPMSEDRKVMRYSLIPSLINVFSKKGEDC